MLLAQLVQVFIERAWLAPLIPITWLILKLTRTARTVATVVRGEIRDRWLRAKGVPEAERCQLAIDTVRRDLES